MGQSKDIAEILRQRDPEKYKHIIQRADLNGYHDFKHDKVPGHPEYADCIGPKAQLVSDLHPYPELADIMKRVMDGEFDESPDEEDTQELRQNGMDENWPDSMFKAIGLEPPTEAERFLHEKRKRKN